MKHMFKKRSNRQLVDASLIVKLLHSLAKTIKRSGYTMQELLPGLEQFLRLGLAKEALSAANERKRQFFIERLEVIKFPPSLPPRPEGLPKIDSFSSQPNLSTRIEDASSKKNQERNQEKKKEKQTKPNGRLSNAVQQPIETETEYDAVDIESIPRHVDDDDVYEGNFDPVYEDPGNGEDKGEWGDDDSGTDYENEADVAEDSRTYVNVDLPQVKNRTEAPLLSEPDSSEQDVIYENTEFLSPESPLEDPFRSKCQKPSDALPMASIVNATITGELSVKQRFGNSKRVCFITENQLICYKKDQEKKPILQLDLSGYDVVGMDGDPYGIRISHPGCSTHIFRADNAESAAAWLKYLSEGAALVATENSVASVPPALPSAPPPSQNITTSGANSEEGSGDGVIGEVQTTEKKKKSKGLGDSLTNLLGTFGLKKGKNLKLAATNLVLDKDAAIGGYMNVSSELLPNKKWVVRWCVVKEGRLDCYMDPGDDRVEFSLALDGVVIEIATKETRKDLAFKLVRNKAAKVYMEASDAMEHGNWMKALIEQTNMASQTIVASEEEEYDDIYDYVCEDELSCSSFSERGDVSSELTTDAVYENSAALPPLPKQGPPLDLNQNDEQYVLADFDDVEYDTVTEAKEEVKRSEETLPEIPLENSTVKTDDEVVKCHSGSTIDEDKGLLETTQNPLLQELRKGRKESASLNELEDKTELLHQQCRDLRKTRLAKRKKIIYEEDATEKRKLETEVASLEGQIEDVQLEMTKLEVLIQELKSSDVKPARNPVVTPRVTLTPKSNRNTARSSPSPSEWKSKERRTSEVQDKARTDAIAASKYSRSSSIGGLRDAKRTSQTTRQAIANLENKNIKKMSPSMTQKKDSGFVAVKSTGGTSYERKDKATLMPGKGETKKKLVQEKLKLFESLTESSA